jgi:hypothetical protein
MQTRLAARCNVERWLQSRLAMTACLVSVLAQSCATAWTKLLDAEVLLLLATELLLSHAEEATVKLILQLGQCTQDADASSGWQANLQ